MNCRKVSHSLSAYIDGELPGVEHRLIHEHLTHCEECRAEQEGLLYTKRLVSRLRLKEPRPELPQAILQRLGSEPRPAPSSSIDALWEKMAQRLRNTNPVGRNLTFAASLAAIGILFVAARVDSADDIQWTPAPAANPMLFNASMPDVTDQAMTTPNGMLDEAMVINRGLTPPMPQKASEISPLQSPNPLLLLHPRNYPSSAFLPVSLQSVNNHP